MSQGVLEVPCNSINHNPFHINSWGKCHNTPIQKSRNVLYIIEYFSAVLKTIDYSNCNVRTHSLEIFLHMYLTIIPRARVGYEMIDSQRGT